MNGGFGLTLGLAREDNATELLINGADIVVEDLSEISIDTINEWFNKGLENEKWTLNYHDYNPENERSRETLLAIGNGFFGTRGAMEESKANKINYPGTYIAGLFNRLISRVVDRDIENEDLVNIPDWLQVNFKPENGNWLSFGKEPNFEIEKIHRKLDFRTGLLTRYIIINDKQGRRTEILSKRFASMDNPHIAGIRYEVSPINYQGTLLIRSGLHGDHTNAGVERYQQLKQKHLEPVLQNGEKGKISLVVKTNNSGITIAQNARHDISIDNKKTEVESKIKSGKGWVVADFNIHIEKGQRAILEKLVSIHTSRDKKYKNPLNSAEKDIESADSWTGMFERSVNKWEKLWENMDIKIDHDRNSQKLVRLHLYHMFVTASEHFTDQDAGIPPRGLHGEAYRGHIFWDELYILPLYNIHMPGVTKASLMYRYRRLDKAREYAKEQGYKGAMFPWQSGSDGREETQIIHLNPLSGEWGDDYSSLQRHISIALAYNVWNYFAATRDEEFMVDYGIELYFEICRFWASKTGFDSDSGSGKSELAHTLGTFLKEDRIRVKVIHADDYYKIQPLLRAEWRRTKGFDKIGINEYDWVKIKKTIRDYKEEQECIMPCIDIIPEQVDKLITDFAKIDLLVIDGLYAIKADDLDLRVFIDLTYQETKISQIERLKETYNKERLEVLKWEHINVKSLKPLADLIVNKSYKVVEANDNNNKNNGQNGFFV